jgi:hypothetical protein
MTPQILLVKVGPAKSGNAFAFRLRQSPDLSGTCAEPLREETNVPEEADNDETPATVLAVESNVSRVIGYHGTNVARPITWTFETSRAVVRKTAARFMIRLEFPRPPLLVLARFLGVARNAPL